MRTTLRVNNTTHELSLDSRLTLLDALRGVLGLTSTKKGCDHGACGACTVIIEGQRVLSCLTLAAACEGQHVVTIEGLASGDELHASRLPALQYLSPFSTATARLGKSCRPSARSGGACRPAKSRHARRRQPVSSATLPDELHRDTRQIGIRRSPIHLHRRRRYPLRWGRRGPSTGNVPTTVAGMASHALDFLDALRLDSRDVLGYVDDK